MARVLISADVHLGLPNKLDDILWALRTMREYARAQGISTVVILGDLFHNRVSISIDVLNGVFDFLSETVKDFGQEWVAFPGNHDMFMRNSWNVNSLRPLDGMLTLVNDIRLLKIHDRRFWVIPFIHYEAVYMKALAKVEEHHEVGDILLTHVGVHNATLNECFLVKHWSTVNFEESKFDRVFAGHFHCHQQVGGRGNVWYPGSPIPFRFDEGMVPHGFIDLDLDTNNVKFIPIFGLADGDRPADFLTITDDMLEDELDIAGDFVRVRLARDYPRDELFRMRTRLLELGAANVKFQKVKEEQVDLAAHAKSDVSLINPTDLFDKWVVHDRPKGLDVELLKKLNASILGE